MDSAEKIKDYMKQEKLTRKNRIFTRTKSRRDFANKKYKEFERRQTMTPGPETRSIAR